MIDFLGAEHFPNYQSMIIDKIIDTSIGRRQKSIINNHWSNYWTLELEEDENQL